MTLERPDVVRRLRIVNEPRKASVVLSQEEVARLLEAAPRLTDPRSPWLRNPGQLRRGERRRQNPPRSGVNFGV